MNINGNACFKSGDVPGIHNKLLPSRQFVFDQFAVDLNKRHPLAGQSLHNKAFAAKKGPALSALDGFSIGMGATCAMFVLGSLREIIGNGTLFDGADTLLGSWAKVLRVEIFHTDSPFLLAMLPPGAFIGLGLMLAGKYLIDERMKKRRTEAAAERALPNGETGNV